MKLYSNEIHLTNYSDDELYTIMYDKTHKGVFVAFIRGENCKTDMDFFHSVEDIFRLPRYFGENWNALDECLTDLDWLKFHEILIVIDRFDEMFCENAEPQKVMLDTLMRHLYLVSEHWSSQNTKIEIMLNVKNSRK